MFKFSTNTILNGATADTLTLTESNGVMVSDAWRSEYGNAKITAVADKYLAIERLGVFRKGNVTKIYRRTCVPGTAGSVKVTCKADATISSDGKAAKAAGIYRLLLYIKLSGSNNSYFANDFVFKGKPLAYEYESKAGTAADIAQGLANAITKESRRFGSKFVNVTVDGADLTITAAGPDACYELFTQADLQKFDAEVNSALVGGEYVTLDNVTVVNTPCKNPFGTYWQIMKDLRLPTADNLRWGGIVADERPALNGQYDQFIIYMCVDRGIMGGDAVGEITKSVTAHSIWVPTGAAATAFAGLCTTYIGVTPEYFEADYKNAAGAFNGWTSAPWNGDTVGEAGANNHTNQDNLDVTKGEAYAGVVGEAPTQEGDH